MNNHSSVVGKDPMASFMDVYMKKMCKNNLKKTEKNLQQMHKKVHWTRQVDLSVKCAAFTTHVSVHSYLPHYNAFTWY